MNARVKNILKYLLSLLLAAVLLWFAFKGVVWKDFLDGLQTTRWGYILLSVLAGFIALVFRAERWRLQLVTLDPSVGRMRIWHGSNIGNFLSLVIPGIGEFYRCGHVCTHKSGYDRTLGTIIMERAWDVLAVVLLLLAAVLCSSDTLSPFIRENVLEPFAGRFSISFWWILGGIVILLTAFSLLLVKFRDKSKFCRKVIDWLRGVLQGFRTFGKMPRKPLFLFYTVGIWTMYIFMAYWCILAVPGLEHMDFADAVFISAIGNIASIIPTPGNMGAYHYLVGLSISSIYSCSWETGLLCATLAHGSHAALLIVLAIHSWIVVTVKKKNN